MQKELIEKECEICGKYFTTTSKLRKYCDECKDNQTRLKERLEKNIRRNRKMYYEEPKPKEYTCDICGKTFKTLPRFLFRINKDNSYDGKDHVFCSKLHEDAYIRMHSNCLNCGKSLDGNLFFKPGAAYSQFCSPKCKAEHKYKTAKENGELKTCVHCGKEYISKDNKYFCSKECHMAAMKNGWRSPSLSKKGLSNPKNEKKEKKIIKRRLQCATCGHETLLELPENKINSIDPFHWYCNEECKKKALEKRLKGINKKIKLGNKPNNNQTHKKNDVTQICASCKTSYKNCERMTSDFRIIPKGAHYNNNGILISCPKFT